LAISLARMRRSSVNSASVLKGAPPSCSATTISYKRTKIVAIWQHYKRVLGIFSPRMRRNGYLGTSGQKCEPAIHSGDLDFHYGVTFIYSMCLCYSVAWPCDLDLSPFYLYSVTCTVLLISDPHYIFITLRLSVTELRVLNIWPHFHYLKQSLRTRRVTWPLTGGKNRPHFWNLWP